MSTLHLVHGARYFAGFSRPFFITDGMIRDAVEAMGGVNIQFHQRADSPLSALSPPLDPRKDPGYSDDWDEWISADYLGPNRQHEAKKRWKWAIRRTFPSASTQAPRRLPGAPPNSLPTPSTPAAVDDSAEQSSRFGAAVGVAAAMLLGWQLQRMLARKRRP